MPLSLKLSQCDQQGRSHCGIAVLSCGGFAEPASPSDPSSMLPSYPSPHRAQLRPGSGLAFTAVLAPEFGRRPSGLRLQGRLSRHRWSLKYWAGFVGALALSWVELSAAVPSAPTAVVAVSGDREAVVSFAPPLSSSPDIKNYTVTASPGGRTERGKSSPLTVTRLTNGTAYTFTVTATNANGTTWPL